MRLISKVFLKMFKTIASCAGYETHLVKRDPRYDFVLLDKNMLSSFYNRDSKINRYYEGLRRSHMEWSDNFSKQCRFYSLQSILEHVVRKRLDGEFAECGCWKGHSTYIIAKIIAESGLTRPLSVFDSFEGLSDKKNEDKNERIEQTPDEIDREKKMFLSSEQRVAEVLSDFKFVKLYKGWIPGRFNEIRDKTFCFVHIDVDLYEPIFESLSFFYPRLASGGCIVLDDYGYTQFPGCKKAVDLFLSKHPHTVFYEMPIGGCFIIK